MAQYEVWEKSTLGTSRGTAAKVFYTLGGAMQAAADLSKGSKQEKMWSYDFKHPDGGTYETVDVPNAYAVIERGNKQSITRGWGVNGIWYDAKDCKRCKNSGMDARNYREFCYACKGASYKPKV